MSLRTALRPCESIITQSSSRRQRQTKSAGCTKGWPRRRPSSSQSKTCARAAGPASAKSNALSPLASPTGPFRLPGSLLSSTPCETQLFSLSSDCPQPTRCLTYLSSRHGLLKAGAQVVISIANPDSPSRPSLITPRRSSLGFLCLHTAHQQILLDIFSSR